MSNVNSSNSPSPPLLYKPEHTRLPWQTIDPLLCFPPSLIIYHISPFNFATSEVVAVIVISTVVSASSAVPLALPKRHTTDIPEFGV